MQYSYLNRMPHYGGVARIACVCAALSVPLTFSMFRVQLGVNVRVSDALAVIAIALAVLAFPRFIASYIRRIGWQWLGLLELYVLMQGLLLGVVESSIKEAIQFLYIWMAVVVAAAFCERYPIEFRRAFIIGIAISLCSTVFYHLAIGQLTRYKLAGEGRYIFGNATVVLFLLMTTFRREMKYVLVTILSVVPLLLSLERRGILGVVAAVILYYFFSAGKILRIRVSEMLVWLFLSVLLLAPATYFAEEESLHDALKTYSAVDESDALWESDVHRSSLIANGISLVQSRPFFGYGADQVKGAMGYFYQDQRLANGTHNFYLDWIIKYGFVGLSILILVLLSALLKVHRNFGYSIQSAVFASYSFLTVSFMADGASVLVMLFSGIYLAAMFRN